jgi:hypothetical protein
MAEGNSGDDFVAKIVRDPKNPPATLMLTGFIGASSEEGHTRLYFDPHLSNYVEIPDDAILHTQSVPADGGLAATYVWIKRDAQLTYGPAGAQRPKGTFLEGPIMQAHMAGAAAAGGAAGAAAGAHGPAAAPPSVVTLCPTQFLACQTHVQPCPTAPTLCCVTPAANCPPSVQQPCVSLPAICTPLCPRTPVVPCITAVVACPTFGACPSIACQVGGPVQQPGAAALPYTSFLCTMNCTIQMAVATQWAGCSQVCHPSFLGMGCGGGGGTVVMALPTLWAYCTQVCQPGGGGGTVVMA